MTGAKGTAFTRTERPLDKYLPGAGREAGDEGRRHPERKPSPKKTEGSFHLTGALNKERGEEGGRERTKEAGYGHAFGGIFQIQHGRFK